MKALHIRDVDSLVIKRIGRLANLHHRSMQAELRGILEEASRRADILEEDSDDSLIFVSSPNTGSYSREEI